MEPNDGSQMLIVYEPNDAPLLLIVYEPNDAPQMLIVYEKMKKANIGIQYAGRSCLEQY